VLSSSAAYKHFVSCRRSGLNSAISGPSRHLHRSFCQAKLLKVALIRVFSMIEAHKSDIASLVQGEHGTGRNVAPYVEMEWGSTAYELMWQLKELFDPNYVLNPGVILNAVRYIYPSLFLCYHEGPSSLHLNSLDILLGLWEFDRSHDPLCPDSCVLSVLVCFPHSQAVPDVTI